MTYVVAYLTVCVGGWFAVACCMYVMRWLTLPGERHKFTEWSVFFVGLTERAVALTLVIFAPPYLPSFIGAWVALKFALGWKRVDYGPPTATGSLLALIGNVLSFAVPIAVGVIFLNPDALHAWATAH
jgi:hypothetical protein